MGFWDRMKGMGRKPRKGTGLEVARWEQAPPRRGTRELLVAYREMPFLRTVVDTVADSVAGVNWRVYRRVKKDGAPVKDFSLRNAPADIRGTRLKELLRTGEAVEVPDHPALALLADPNDLLTGRAITKLQQVYLDLVGEAFFVLDIVGSQVVGMWPLPPNAVVQLPRYDQPRDVQTYRVMIGGKARELPASQVIHLRNLDPEDPLGRGVGAAFALGDELDTDEYAARFVKNSFWNNMMPAAIASIEGMNDSNAPAAKTFKESLAREHQGPDKAGKLLITSGKVSLARFDSSFKDMELVTLRKYLHDFIRMTYRIPPETVGNTSASNKATAFAARENMAEQATAPRMEFLRTEYQARLMPLFDREAILHYDSPVPADREHQLRVMGTMPQAFSYDEWREVGGRKPDPNRQGYPAPMPGQQSGGQQTPDAEPGGAAEAAEDGKRLPAGDPPWAGKPLR